MRRLTERSLRTAAVELGTADPALGASLERYGPPPLWAREPSYATLTHLILEQQVSLASAAAAYERLLARTGEPLTPPALLALTDAELLAAGFSRQKTRYTRALAAAVEDGSLDVDGLGALDDAGVDAALTALPGIGPWTADIYLLFCLGRADAFAAGDLALQIAARAAMSLDDRPSRDELFAIAERWRPWRGVAAHLLWAYYKVADRALLVPKNL